MTASGKTPLARRDIPALLIIAAFGIFAALSINDTMYYTPDSAHYLGWANSLASFEGFVLTYGPEPSRYVVNAPLYAVLLAPAALVFPLDVVAAKMVTLVFGVLLLLLFYRFTVARLGTGPALAGVFLLAVNPYTILFSTQILSDVPFGVCVLLILILVSRLVHDQAPPRWMFFGLLGLLSIAVLLREVGFAFLLAVTVFFALRKDYTRASLIFLAPLLFYLLWYVRNEVVVGNAELPDIRNTGLFLSHILTGEGSTLLDESAARIANNFQFYAEPVGGMLFISQYVGWDFGVLNLNDPLLAGTQSIVGALRIPIILLTLLIVGGGIRWLWKSDPIGRLMALFLFFYVAVILFYPICDIRFLFPVLLLMVYGAGAAMHGTIQRFEKKPTLTQRRVLVAITAGVVLLAIPGMVWQRNFLATAMAHSNSPEALFQEIKDEVEYPVQYTKPFREVAEWMAARGDSSSLVVGRYKEAAVWLGQGTFLSLDPLISPESFDVMVRDYRCRYVIAHLAGHQLRDFEFQMAVSRRFRFEPVHRVGDLEILQVHRNAAAPATPAKAVAIQSVAAPRGTSMLLFDSPLKDRLLRQKAFSPDSLAGNASLRQHLLTGIDLLNNGNYAGAKSAFQQLRRVSGLEAESAFYTAVATEFSLNLREARERFQEFRRMPQAGILLRQAQMHQDIILSLESASRATTAVERASFYHTVSLSYWLLGFRTPAVEMLQRCLSADSTYFVGPVFGALYALQQADTVTAKRYVAWAGRLRPKDDLVKSLNRILRIADSLDSPQRTSHLLGIAREYGALGLNDFAADELLHVLEDEPRNADALHSLAHIYISKRRFAPAKWMLMRLLEVQPGDDRARKMLEGLP